MTDHFIPALPEAFADFAETFQAMSEAAVARFSYCSSRRDITFGPLAELAALVRSATTLEGGLIEQGLRALLQSDPRLLVIEPVLRLPILEEAMAAVKANDFKSLSKVRFDPKAYAERHYTPDLIVIDRTTQIAHLLELKRSSESFGTGYLTALEKKMQAATLVLPHMLFYRNYPVVSDVNMLIVDCDDGDKRDEVVSPRDLDHAFNCPGLADALGYLRHVFARAVQKRMGACMAQPGGDGFELGLAAFGVDAEGGGDVAVPGGRHDRASTDTGQANPPALGAVNVTVGRKRGRPKKTAFAPDADTDATPGATHKSPSAPGPEPVKLARKGKSGPSFPGSISMGSIDPNTPGEDPAAIVGLAVRMGLMGQVDRTGLPAPLREALRDLADEGEPAAVMVLEWLDRVLLSKISSEAGNA